MSTQNLAFEVELNEWRTICFGPTPAAAKWQAVAAFREAGYGGRRWWPAHLKASRRPEYDTFLWRDCRSAWAEEYVKGALQ